MAAVLMLSTGASSAQLEFWSTSGNPGTISGEHFLGTPDNVPFEIRVNNQRVARFEDQSDPDLGFSPNVILGSDGNGVENVLIHGASIGGGGRPDQYNRVTSDYGTVAGGIGNVADNRSFVGGGTNNEASGINAVIAGGILNISTNFFSVVSGGSSNSASGEASMILGGIANSANENFSLAAGRRAVADHPGAFVWADCDVSCDSTVTGAGFEFISTAPNEFAARATGGVRFVTEIDGAGNPTAGVSLGSGDTSWGTISDLHRKKDFTSIDGSQILASLAELPITTWRYEWENSDVLHMGPMAQEFYEIFGLGRDEKVITTQEADGVLFAAVKALTLEIDEKNKEIEDLRVKYAELVDRISRLENK